LNVAKEFFGEVLLRLGIYSLFTVAMTKESDSYFSAQDVKSQFFPLQWVLKSVQSE